jgi:hypothetical protein
MKAHRPAVWPAGLRSGPIDGEKLLARSPLFFVTLQRKCKKYKGVYIIFLLIKSMKIMYFHSLHTVLQINDASKLSNSEKRVSFLQIIYSNHLASIENVFDSNIRLHGTAFERPSRTDVNPDYLESLAVASWKD